MDKIRILWADDEMDHLKPQIFFLEKKGYQITPVTNGHDAIRVLQESGENYELVFLDESMPGISGIETLTRIKQLGFTMPVVLVTKNEAENLMEEAIGGQIADYLIKPVNPNQLLLSIKKLIDHKRLVSEKNNMDYQVAFRSLFLDINNNPDYNGWADIYKKLIQWELKLDEASAPEIQEILAQQKLEANVSFSKYIVAKYPSWFHAGADAPTLSHQLLVSKVLPFLSDEIPTILLLLDNLRYDQWKTIETVLNELYRTVQEDFFYSILPTTTQYSRNAIFAGMLPAEIQKYYPDWWLSDHEEGGKNQKEPELLSQLLAKRYRKEMKFAYCKVTNAIHGKQLVDQAHQFLSNKLTVIVYNFIDMLSHARTEMEVLKELAADEKAYRSLTRSWFVHSPLWQALQRLALGGGSVQLIVTTDHGTIRVKEPSKVMGDRDTTTNLRYKVGKNLNYDKKQVLEIKDPQKVGLPSPNLSSTYIFAKEQVYFLYPNHYNQFLNYYKNTFQHGGISMEEMICPVVRLISKGK